MENSFSPQEQCVYTILYYGSEKSIEALYYAAKGYSVGVPHRKMQQHVGALVSKINKKLDGHIIKPGSTKRTYILTTK